MDGDEQSRALASGSPSSCSRMRRLLFRRTRSETEDGRTRNSRLSKTEDSSTPEPVHSRLNLNPSAVVVEEATVPSLTRLHSLMPRSPPPPYDTNSDVIEAEAIGWLVCNTVVIDCRANPSVLGVYVRPLTTKPWRRTGPTIRTTDRIFRQWSPPCRPDTATAVNVKWVSDGRTNRVWDQVDENLSKQKRQIK